MKKNNSKLTLLLLLPTLISSFPFESSAQDSLDSNGIINSNIILNSDLNGRINATDKLDFSRKAGNIAGVLKKNTSGLILKVVKMPSGNLGIKLRITSGNFSGEDLWIYYNIKNPTVEFSKNKHSKSDFDNGNKARLLTDLDGHEDLENESLKDTLEEALPMLTNGVDKQLQEIQRIKCQDAHEETTNKIVSYGIKNGVVTKNGVPMRIDGERVTSLESPKSEVKDLIPTPNNTPLPAVLSLLNQAKDLEAQGQLENAVSAIERALNISPQYPPLYLKLAELNILQNHFTNAYHLALKGLSKRPDEVTKFELNKVKNNAEMNKINKAESDTSYQKELMPVVPLTIKPRSAVQQVDDSIAEKHLDEAVERLDGILKNAPDDYQSYNKLIDIKMSQKFFTEAKQIAERAQQSQMPQNEKLKIKTKALEAQVEIEKVNLKNMKKGN